MTKNKDRITERLESISKAKPAASDSPLKKPRKKKRAEWPERRAVFHLGKIYVEGDQYFPCVIRDISEGGARVAMESITSLPPVVMLLVPQSGLRKKAKVVWQDDTETGLQFIVET